MKKILFLGAAHFQLPPIEYALKAGYYVITADNLKHNPGHRLANKSFSISTTDKKNILKIAEEENVDGVLAFGSDLSMLTSSYVTNKLGLPGNDLDIVEKLVFKSKFRKFLNKNGLQDFPFKIFHISQKFELIDYVSSLRSEQIIKPVDGNGSKGVSILSSDADIEKKINEAFNNSVTKNIILEKYIHKKPPQICGDGFFYKGSLRFIYFGDGYFYNDKNYLAPWGETFPSIHNDNILKKAKKKIELILTKLGFKTGPFNFDIFVTKNDDIIVNEIGPRSGGNFIPTIIKKQTGVDMIKGAVENCIDDNFLLSLEFKKSKNYFGSYMIHLKNNYGRFESVNIPSYFLKFVHKKTIYKNKKELVEPFISGNKALGNVIIKTKSINKMRQFFNSDIHKYFNIKLS